jgi:hypothetical protein
MVLRGREPIEESLNNFFVYPDSDLTKTPGQAKDNPTTYDNTTALAHAVARVQTVPTPAP